jgi:hypothetical protein
MRNLPNEMGYHAFGDCVTRGISPRIWPSVLGILSCVLIASPAPAQPKTRNVLVVLSSNQYDPKYLDLLESTIRARVPGEVDFYTASLDYQRFADESYEESLAQTYRREYRNVRADVVVAMHVEALEFTEKYRGRMFPGVPIVFTGSAASELDGEKMPPGVTGVEAPVGLRETIDLALRLQPDTKAVAVIDAGHNFWWRVAHAELLRHESEVREIDILGPPSPGMLQRIAALPPHTVILFQLAPESSTDPAIKTDDVLALAAEHLPTYSAWPSLCLDHGCIGGAFPDSTENMRRTGELAARAVLGTRPEDIPIAKSPDTQVQVDWRAVRHWHIPESRLPPGSVILYRQPSLWDEHREFVIAAGAVIVVLLLLIIGLLWQRERKRKAEAVLGESEKRFRVMADTTPSLI